MRRKENTDNSQKPLKNNGPRAKVLRLKRPYMDALLNGEKFYDIRSFEVKADRVLYTDGQRLAEAVINPLNGPIPADKLPADLLLKCGLTRKELEALYPQQQELWVYKIHVVRVVLYGKGN